MSATFNNVFILGATSGLGAGLARRYYETGKKVMIAGRRQERLQAMRKEMPNLETIQIDVEDLEAFPNKMEEVITRFPDLDQIILMAGKASFFDFKDPSTSSDAHIASEMVTNVTFPLIASRFIVPRFISRNKPAQIVLVTSGLAFIPFPLYPTYCPSKAAIHVFACTLRGQLAKTPITVTELVPPYVDTDFDKDSRAKMQAILGEKSPKPLPLSEFVDQAYTGLEDRSEGKPKGEVTVGSAVRGAGAWWGTFGPILDNFGLSAMKP